MTGSLTVVLYVAAMVGAIFDLQVQEDTSEPDGAVLAPYPKDATLTG